MNGLTPHVRVAPSQSCRKTIPSTFGRLKTFQCKSWCTALLLIPRHIACMHRSRKRMASPQRALSSTRLKANELEKQNESSDPWGPSADADRCIRFFLRTVRGKRTSQARGHDSDG